MLGGHVYFGKRVKPAPDLPVIWSPEVTVTTGAEAVEPCHQESVSERGV